MTLIDRLSKLDGPDREVDREIHFATGRQLMIPPYTASVDAAIALADRVLPGWKWGMHHHRGLIRAYVSKNSPFRPMPVIADHSAPAIALCVAILRVKEASHGE